MVRVAADNLRTLPRGVEPGSVTPEAGLTESGSFPSWSLDKVGNWLSWNDNGTSETRQHNALNQITQKGAAACTYDDLGNLTNDGERFTYVYDPNNRLKEVKDRATGESIVTCKYDALGRRVERNVLKPVEYQTGGITRYYYAGQRIVEERNEQDFIQAVYTYGQYIDEPLSMDHVPTSQPTGGGGQQPSMPAVRTGVGGEGIGNGQTPEVAVSPTAGPEVLVSPTATAFPRGTGILPVTPSVTSVASVVNTPFYTPTIWPSPTVPADLYATEAAAMSTPAPTDTPVAMATVPPDPYATQAAEMFATFPPLSSPTPWATATVSASVTAVPSVVETPSPLSHVHTENSQPALTRYYYHANRLYSVSALTDAAGTVVERYQYNAYGLCTTFNASYELPLAFSRFGNPFTFTGRELDPEIEAMHYRHRTYLLHLARFAQLDPIGYEGGINLYEYVGSNPVLLLDPNGLEPNPTWQDQPGSGSSGSGDPDPLYDQQMKDETYNRWWYHKDCASGKRTDCQPEPEGGHKKAAAYWEKEFKKHSANYERNKGGGGGLWVSDYYKYRVTKQKCCDIGQAAAELACAEQIAYNGAILAGWQSVSTAGEIGVGVAATVGGPTILVSTALGVFGPPGWVVGGVITGVGLYFDYKAVDDWGNSVTVMDKIEKAKILYCNCDKIVK